MWIIFKKNYSGPLGLFAAGQKMDLPKEKIEQLKKELGNAGLAETRPPWEEGLDKKAEAAAKQKHEAALAVAKVIAMKKEIAGLRKVAGRINELKKELADAEPKAKALAKQAGIEWPESGE